MLILKHLKTLQHISIIIQIIFRELVCSLLKSLNLKICYECKKSNVVGNTGPVTGLIYLLPNLYIWPLVLLSPIMST